MTGVQTCALPISGPEIWNDTDGNIDIFVAGVGTGGTLTGVSRFLKKTKGLPLTTVAVEPSASPLITQKRAGQPLQPAGHKIQGIGANFIPEILDRSVIDEILPQNAETAVEYARLAAAQEGLLVGISSGAALAAAAELAARDETAGKTIVVIIPSFGERYLSTILYSDLMD